ncbi:MAG: aminoacyl-tRNA hydrolase [Thermodesulfovibrio sp.]|nr:aminoacyl-tRNA hydrolase [Thermodesulfovibrio sp.]
MNLIVGLGNPGRKYSKTRHNIGFMVVDKLAEKYNLDFNEKDDYLISRGNIEGKEVALIKPLTYMNLSGRAVRKIADERILKNLPNSLIVIHDDLDLPVGRIKIKKNGSSGGHKGVQSIIDLLGTRDFIRVKIGIGKEHNMETSDYVLSPFSKEQKTLIKQKISKAIDSIVTIITEGVDKAMSIYNREDC